MSAGSASEGAPAAQQIPASPESFGAWLAGRSDEQLLELLQSRPDVSVPPPPDFEVLARRLGASASVARTMERVDLFGLEVLEVLALLARAVPVAELAEVSGLDEPRMRPALDRLRRLGLIWGDDVVHLPRGVADELGPRPLGLGRSAAELLRTELETDERANMAANLGLKPNRSGAVLPDLIALFSDPERVDRLLRETDAPGRALLEQLGEGSPVGSTGSPVAVPLLAYANTAVARLLARGLLMPSGGDLVELPREVALGLRRAAAGTGTEATLLELVAGRVHPDPPELAGAELDPADVDTASATTAAEMLRWLDALLNRWEQAPPVLTRNGGLPVRELRATAKDLALPADTVAILAELARAASLLAETPGFDTSIVPTEYVDAWRTLPNEQRWAVVAAGWLGLDAYPGLATSVQPARGPDGAGKPLPVFSWDLRRAGAVLARREVLGVLAAAPPGTAPGVEAVRARLTWQGPRRHRLWWDAVVDWTLAEAGLLGVTGRGALGSAGRALLSDGSDAAATALGRSLPAPVDHVLIQGDLTAVAPGPLEPVLAREMGLVADVESAGTATVFRFSESSIRRALDAGRSGADVQALIAGAARGPVPQSLTYLVDDVARRHGRIRAGTVASYLRCDDPALLAEVVVARRTGSVHLRRVAPTVAVSTAPLDRVLEVLRSAGYTPASEGPDGTVRVERAPVERVPVPARRPAAAGGSGIPKDHLSATVLRLRRAENAARSARSRGWRDAVAGSTVRLPGQILTRLSTVAEQGGAVQMSYVNLEGRSSTRVVHPLLLSGGFLTAYDEQSGERRTFAVSRISSLAELDGPLDADAI
jgi:hypothetical protein